MELHTISSVCLWISEVTMMYSWGFFLLCTLIQEEENNTDVLAKEEDILRPK
jgi:hypothetical protein